MEPIPFVLIEFSSSVDAIHLSSAFSLLLGIRSAHSRHLSILNPVALSQVWVLAAHTNLFSLFLNG